MIHPGTAAALKGILDRNHKWWRVVEDSNWASITIIVDAPISTPIAALFESHRNAGVAMWIETRGWFTRIFFRNRVWRVKR